MSGSPWSGYVRAYEVDAAASDIFVGDLVIMEADGKVAPATAGDGHIVGVCVGALNHLPSKNSGVSDHFMASSSPTLQPSYSSGAGQILVAVGTDIIYEAQEDGDTDPLAIIDIGSNVDMIATHSGSTTTGRSGQEIDSDSHVTTSAQLKLVGFVDRPDNEQGDVGVLASGDNARWLVRINESHFFTVSATTAGLQGV
jgi:hypothetical protein